MHTQEVLRRQHAFLLACSHNASAGMAGSLITGHCAFLHIIPLDLIPYSLGCGASRDSSDILA